jgi:tetratricopeptide (TPR) repeat protein
VNLHWDIPDVPSQRRQDGLYLPLVCKDCGRQREHFTAYILADINALADAEPNPKYGAHILDHEVVCPKCGAVDRYELTPVAHLRIAGPDAIATIIREELGEKTKPFNSNPRVLYFRSVVFGEPMHPLEGLDKYRAQIAANPGDALLHSRMGSLLRILMRYEEALKALRHAYQLAPDDPEVIIRLAYSEHDFGDREAACNCIKNHRSQLNQGIRVKAG